MISSTDRIQFETRIPDLHVMVIGDLMLDRYLWGTVNRISPEAPVPVVDISRSEDRPGGAANVALNLKSMGARVSIAGAIGDDIDGTLLLEILQQKGFDTDLVLVEPDRITTTKTRVLGNRQQMLRIDQEQKDELTPEAQKLILTKFSKLVEEVDVLIFEDYDKGVLNPSLIAEIISLCNQNNIPTIVDPKFKNFFSYQNCTLFKPNLKELNDGLGIQVKNTDLDELERAVGLLREKMPHNNTLITLSENGVLALDSSSVKHIQAHYRKITDVSGAGDTVVALMGLALGAGLPLSSAATIANLGGGLVCEEVGVVPIDRSRLLKELT